MQSSALPLGHAAIPGVNPGTADRISRSQPARLLLLSNGHGEDLIALRIGRALRERRPAMQLCALPLVGEGEVYRKAEQDGWLQQVGPRQRLPSGGFSNQSLPALLHDLRAGLPALSWRQWQLVRRWGDAGDPILAVGDLLPLLLAWGSGAPYGFLGTPKSDYTWRSGPDRDPLADRYHRCKGSEWDPWEWALMADRRAKLVAVRDGLTARGLRRRGVAALAPGNPMMDGLDPAPLPEPLRQRRRIVLLCGSRLPEALGNARRLLEGLACLPTLEPQVVLCPTGSRPSRQDLDPLLRAQGYTQVPITPGCGASAAWGLQQRLVLLGQGCFESWAGWGEVGLATAGTATEQLVGLGVPVLSMPGPGPQFKRGFARRQSRLLGGGVRVCTSPLELAGELDRLLKDAQLRRQRGCIGRRRMGDAGGSERLAALVDWKLLSQPQG
ncbi:sugar synthetase [Synechococcus sp. BSF8S]|nr:MULTISPECIES: lipid-A-disaccharide synthase-related protein [unclassified Synechococcus]MBC1259744.1 sugar synthetase [Synechococcus sp. BSF8S]MBC1262833.1 sugar synthetase [Synechococcus sp. BSA11S]